jgi:hypothetical protein
MLAAYLPNYCCNGALAQLLFRGEGGVGLELRIERGQIGNTKAFGSSGERSCGRSRQVRRAALFVDHVVERFLERISSRGCSRRSAQVVGANPCGCSHLNQTRQHLLPGAHLTRSSFREFRESHPAFRCRRRAPPAPPPPCCCKGNSARGRAFSMEPFIAL